MLLICKIIEIGAVKVEKGQITDRFSTFVNPEVPIPFRIEQLTSINDSMVLDAPTIEEVLPKFLEFCEGCVMVAHTADFYMSFIIENCKRQGIPDDFTYVDTVGMARFLLPALNRFKLDTVAKAVGVSLDHHHRAVDDAACTAEIFVRFVKMLEERDIFDVDEMNSQGAVSPDTIRKLPTYHAIVFARNETGRINLYKLVSQSHLKYYHRRPRVPKSVLEKYRDGLMAPLIGTFYQRLGIGDTIHVAHLGMAGNATQFRFKDSEGNKAKGEFVFDKSGELYVKVKTYKRADGSKTYPKTESIMRREAPVEEDSSQEQTADNNAAEGSSETSEEGTVSYDENTYSEDTYYNGSNDTSSQEDADIYQIPYGEEETYYTE